MSCWLQQGNYSKIGGYVAIHNVCQDDNYSCIDILISSPEVGALPKDPTGPPSLNRLETSTVGQFSISFSNAAPAQPQGDNRVVNATPIVFLLRLEETISRNASYIWLVSGWIE